MRIKIVITRTEVLIFLLMLPIIKPTSLQGMSKLLDNLFDFGRIISVIMIVFIIIFSRTGIRKLRVSFWLLLLLESWIAFVTVFKNPHRFPASMISGGVILGISMIVSYFARKNPGEFLKALMANFEWLIYVHLFTQIVVPEGLYQIRRHPVYFLGLDNGAIIYILPALTIAYLYYLCIGKKLRPLLLASACVASTIIGWCATSVVGLITAGILILLINGRKLRKWIKLIHIWIVAIIIDILITIFRIMDTFPPLKRFIVDFLGKNTTLTGRTMVWDDAIMYWRRSPVIGNGFNTIIYHGQNAFNHAHNAYFQYLMISGVIGLALFVLYNLSVIRNFDKKCGASKSGKAIKVAFSVLFITYITEAYNFPLLFILYSLAECVPLFVSVEEEKSSRKRLAI